MKIAYQIFIKEKVLIQRFTGIFSIEHYIQYKKFVTNNPSINSVKNVIIDFRETDFRLSSDEFEGNLERMKEIMLKNNNKQTIRDGVKIVFLVDAPIPTVIAHIFKSKFSYLNYQYCSSVEGLQKIIELPEYLNDLNWVISQLNSTFIFLK